MHSYIATEVRSCIQEFGELPTSLEARGDVELSSQLGEERDRFHIWAGNIGAFQQLPNKTSLDWRLRNAPKISAQVIELLEDIREALSDISSIALGNRENRRDIFSLSELNEISSCGDMIIDNDTTEITELQEILETLQDSITGLFRISSLISEATPRDRYIKALMSSTHRQFDESFDISHVMHRFPRLRHDDRKWLGTRLGKAIARRRGYLRYCREHRERLGREDNCAPDTQPALELQPKTNTSNLGDKRTVGTSPSMFATTAASTFVTQMIPQNDLQELVSNDGQSELSVTTAGEEFNDAELKIMPLGEVIGQRNGAFECPYCKNILNIKQERKWRKHVLSDLRPYVCTFKECELRMFGERRAWFLHELEHHRAQWQCRFCTSQPFHDKGSLELHLARRHHELCSASQLHSLLELSRQSPEYIAANDCPFCDDFEARLRLTDQIEAPSTVLISSTQFSRHVASHMEQLALFAIPRGYLEKDDMGSGNSAMANFDEGEDSQASAVRSELYCESLPKLIDQGATVSDGQVTLVDDKGPVMNLAVGTDLIVPTLDGFRAHARKLNPRLQPAIMERVAKEQTLRYKKLVDLKLKHADAVSQHMCAAGKHCFNQGGIATYLTPQTSPKNPQFLVNSSRTPEDGLSDGVVVSALFPPGVPLPPVSHLPAEFECSLCFKVKKFQKPSDWTKHVHEDLQPFTCTFPECTEPKSFKRKADWVRHEDVKHRHLVWWTCNFPDCLYTSDRKDKFIQHLALEHKILDPKNASARSQLNKNLHAVLAVYPLTREQSLEERRTLVDECKHETEKKVEGEACCFCGNVYSRQKKLADHMARHMEQISMPVLELVKHVKVAGKSDTSGIHNGPPIPKLMSPMPGKVPTPGLTTAVYNPVTAHGEDDDEFGDDDDGVSLSDGNRPISQQEHLPGQREVVLSPESSDLSGSFESPSLQPDPQAAQQGPSTADLDEPGTVGQTEGLERSRDTSGFKERYRIIQQLGRGHFATVYHCVERSTGVHYAVKRFGKPAGESQRQDDGIQNEIAILKGVSHPNVLSLKDTFDESDAMYLVQELAPEGELLNWIVAHEKLTEDETRHVFRQLFHGLKHLHERNIIHRDIKPENILLLDTKLTVKLADFCLAEIIGEDSFTTTLSGTPSYIAPEVLENSRHGRCTRAIDIWSLGVVLYICLCGFPPFSDELYSRENPYTLTDQIKMGIFDYPSPYWDHINDPALDLIDRMLTVDPDQRITINECLEHPWLTNTYPNVADSIEGLTGASDQFDFSRRKVARERTLLSSINSQPTQPEER
ncbi:CAMK protein kinase [Polytolypa hystricis UAMH7299]|uniref:CAMK protein kinase n=1 Tax=Polytolypa hystricis (strain UAMH7299) TaxID=1447883 RepID=A0A2B7X6Q6_POLH7|nr:CAMK protein kinase [Polytolypa hystricis UAMH7299]